MTTPTVTELTIKPLAPGHFLRACRTLANHVIVLEGDHVRFCGTDRADAARVAATIADSVLSVEHTTGRDSRA